MTRVGTAGIMESNAMISLVAISLNSWPKQDLLLRRHYFILRSLLYILTGRATLLVLYTDTDIKRGTPFLPADPPMFSD